MRFGLSELSENSFEDEDFQKTFYTVCAGEPEFFGMSLLLDVTFCVGRLFIRLYLLCNSG